MPGNNPAERTASKGKLSCYCVTPPAEIKERTALTVNPAKTCQPIGAMYAALGIHGCLPHSHGSQGCYAYHRSALTRHYKEPVMAATSAFTEGASVFGGQANLLQAIDNIFSVYEPGGDRRAHHLPVGNHRRRHPPDRQQGRPRARFPRASTSSTPTPPATSARTSPGSPT
jgi:hypothetical protein